MDINFIIEAINPFVFFGCVMIGFIVKLWTSLDWVNNKLIPTILAVVGALAYYFIYGNSLEYAVIGAFVGIAATGGYELVNNLILLVKDKSKKEE